MNRVQCHSIDKSLSIHTEAFDGCLEFGIHLFFIIIIKLQWRSSIWSFFSTAWINFNHNHLLKREKEREKLKGKITSEIIIGGVNKSLLMWVNYIIEREEGLCNIEWRKGSSTFSNQSQRIVLCCLNITMIMIYKKFTFIILWTAFNDHSVVSSTYFTFVWTSVLYWIVLRKKLTVYGDLSFKIWWKSWPSSFAL